MRPTLLATLLVAGACNDDTSSNPPPPVPSCTTTADCTTGTCLDSRCVQDGSVAGGRACDLDQQCRSGTCATDTCEYAPGEPGGPCDTGDTCDAGASCLVDVCVADGSLSAGASCDLSAQCASEACLSLVCAAGLGESCSTLPCAPDTMTCLIDTCIANGSLGVDEPCTEDVQCASGDCAGTCAPPECEPTGPAGSLTFTGAMDASLPGDAVLVVLWLVTSGSPDYEWVFGSATAAGTSLSVNLPTMPPAQAVNSYGLAVGVVIAFPSGTVVPTGEFVDPGVDWIGATDRHAIIWKASCGIDEMWPSDFDPGYACGVCVPAARGETFDSYQPTDCSNVTVHPDDQSFDFCNWT